MAPVSHPAEPFGCHTPMLCRGHSIFLHFTRSPHSGGIWEVAVESLKTHLRRTLVNALITTEQFKTFVRVYGMPAIRGISSPFKFGVRKVNP